MGAFGIELPIKVSAAQIPTFEELRAMFAETREQIAELRLSQKETNKQIAASQKETNRKIAALGNRIGELIESMVEGGIIRLFQSQGYLFNRCSRHLEFNNKELGIEREIDLFLENGEYALLVEVKTNLWQRLLHTSLA